MTKNNIFIIYFKRVIKKVNKYTEDKKRKYKNYKLKINVLKKCYIITF